jgi:membrane protein DedA with SNARE-associated domain
MHTQLIIGVLLYFVSPTIKGFMEAGDVMKNSAARFFVVEHAAMMIIAIAVLTVGYSKGKRAIDEATKHRKIFFAYLIALIILIVSIPWPIREVGAGRGWF